MDHAIGIKSVKKRGIVKTALRVVFIILALTVFIGAFGTWISCKFIEAVNGIRIINPACLIPIGYDASEKYSTCFRGYKTADGRAFLRCDFYMENLTDTDKTFTLTLFSPADRITGLTATSLFEPVVTDGLSKGNTYADPACFHIPARTKAFFKNVIFRSETGPNAKKFDKSLPMVIYGTRKEETDILTGISVADAAQPSPSEFLSAAAEGEDI